MNGDSATPPEAKAEPDELHKASMESSSSIAKSSPLPSQATLAGTTGPTKSMAGRSSAASPSSDVLPDSLQHPSHASTPDVYPVKSHSVNCPSLSSPAARSSLASLPSAKRKRLSQDKVGQLEDRIALDARDADAWLALIGEHQEK